MQVRGMPTVDHLKDRPSSKLLTISIAPQVELSKVEVQSHQQQPQLHIDVPAHELGAMVSNEAIGQQVELTDVDCVTEADSAAEADSIIERVLAIKRLPDIALMRSPSSLRQENDDLFLELSDITRGLVEEGEPKSNCSPLSPTAEEVPELDSDTSSQSDGTERYQSDTNILFRFGSPRIQAVPAVHRLRFSTQITEPKDLFDVAYEYVGVVERSKCAA
jgi:hypothetical protein